MDAMRLYTLLCILCTFLPLTLAQQETPEVLAQKRVVMIRATLESQGQLNEVFGAGVIAGWENGLVYIFTANHVVRERFEIAENITAEFFDFPGRPVTALLLRDFDSERDLAMVSVDTSLLPQNVIDALPPLVTGDVNTLRFGERVFAVGYKGSKTWATLGLSEFYDLELDMVVFGSSSIDKGASGGGLFNENWELIGMVVNTNGSEAKAVRIDRIVELLSQWRYPVGNPVATSEALPSYPCSATVIISTFAGNGLNQVRSAPGLGAPLTSPVRQGSTISVTEKADTADGIWYKISYSYNQQDRTGWLPERFLELAEICP
jgi:hypothetical protein